MAFPAAATAEPADPTESDAPPVANVQIAAPNTNDANPAAVSACSRFAAVLDSTALYYDNFAVALETYTRPDQIGISNTMSRTALRQGAAEALSAANTPGLPSDVAGPMRSWSLDATKLLLKMGLRGTGETLDVTAAAMNGDAYAVQQACAAAGTHA